MKNLVLVFCLAGCSTERTAFVSKMTSLICDNYEAPCTAAGYPFSKSACAKGVAAFWQDPGSAGVFSPSNAALCEATPLAQVVAGQLDPACVKIYQGTLAAGASCTGFWQCPADDGYCSDTNICAETRDETVGLACNQTPTAASPYSDYCYDPHTDLYCSTAGVCTPTVAGGDTCQFGLAAAPPCADGFFCASSNQCTAALAPGAACDPSIAAQCGDDNYCGGGTCTPRITANGACVPGAADSLCAPDLYCSKTARRCVNLASFVDAQFCSNLED